MSARFRQFHRWVSMVFTLTVAANFVAMSFGTPPSWITYSPLLPLALLLLTGLYLFVLPYRRRRGEPTDPPSGRLIHTASQRRESAVISA
jgi:hypothetical protein